MTEVAQFSRAIRIFIIVGVFIPGFTAGALLGLQWLIFLLGVECSMAWNILWGITSCLSITLPLWFYQYIKYTKHSSDSIIIRLSLFNIFEYLFIQATLAMFFTNGKTLCYVGDGQNGLELVFTAWLALPIIYVLGFLFKKKLADKN